MPASFFLSSIKERLLLNPHSSKQTFHIVLDLMGSGIEYAVGDCLGICPENDPFTVTQIIKALKAEPQTTIQTRDQRMVSLHDFLSKHANFVRPPKKLGGNHLLQHLQQFPAVPKPQEFCSQFLPLLPRFYSLASSMNVVGHEGHLTVELSENPSDALSPFGTCSHFLCVRAPIGIPAVPVFLQRSKEFFLPPEAADKPIIMIGPGTGVAPFRGFMQERVAKKATGKNWLFFGERHAASDFYYGDYWSALQRAELLHLDTAFSRDQDEKVYVQHRMLEKKQALWAWIEKGQGYIYVCGDAKEMARDVEKTLIQIFATEGKMELAAAKIYLKNLKLSHRYQTDTY